MEEDSAARIRPVSSFCEVDSVKTLLKATTKKN